MKAEDIVRILDARLLSGTLPAGEVQAACGSDMMSDVLAYPKERMVLLTGLTNLHVVRTCEMLDVMMIVFVRGKVPPREVLWTWPKAWASRWRARPTRCMNPAAGCLPTACPAEQGDRHKWKRQRRAPGDLFPCAPGTLPPRGRHPARSRPS